MAARQGLARWQAWAVLGVLLAGVHGQAANEAVEARMRRDVTFLASDECQGRGVTTKGIELAADYIANEFKKAGLKPAGSDGSYFQPFSISGSAKPGSPNSLVLQGPQGQAIALRQGADFQIAGCAASGKLTAPLVFLGYAASAKDYNDFQDVDVAGKLVVVLRRTPRAGNDHAVFDGENNSRHAALNTKIANAELHNAAGVLFINDRGLADRGDKLMDFGYTSRNASASIPVVQVRRSIMDSLLQSSFGKRLTQVEEDIDRTLKPQSAPLAGWTADLEVNVERQRTPCKNIIATIDGYGPLANEVVIIGAHYDHLGYGGFGSLDRKQAGKAIHHGADDNASGTTTLLELARRFAQRPERSGRRLVFMAFSAEESGLLGSAHYCRHPIFPLADTVAMINMDMVGRLRPDKQTHKIDTVNVRYDFKLQKIASGMGPSDQQSFYEKKIPVFFFFTGDHPDYHRPSDTADKINVPGMARVADLVEDLTEYLDTVPQRPQYVQVISLSAAALKKRVGIAAGSAAALAGSRETSYRMQGPTLGIMPAYDDDKEGVLLSGVRPGGPAAKAGLKEGDRIVEMAGKPVRNLQSYMALMNGQKQGGTLEVIVVRDGKRVPMKVHLE
ncbi:MAG: M28 family peptidase [Planctomycetota bacterium]|nr:MAG: M28 family peptidase [Planctomycetota bacterium]